MMSRDNNVDSFYFAIVLSCLSDDLYMSICVSLLILEECEIHLGFACCDTDP